MQAKPIAVMTVLSLVLASLLVAGCSSTQTTQTTDNTTKLGYMGVEAAQVPAPTTIGSSDVYTPKQGYAFVTFNATVTNINATSRNVHTSYFTLHDSNNSAYLVSRATTDKSIEGFPNNVVTNPGDKVNGLLVFEVPQNATLATLVYDDGLAMGRVFGGYAGNVTVEL